MSNFLVIFDRGWADEFQCQRFAVFKGCTEAEIDEKIQDVVNNGGYFGTNEGYEEEELDESAFTVKEISDHEAAIILDLLGQDFGTGLMID